MALLEVGDVSVSFGGTRALQNVSMLADEGNVVGLIGPNGAGKTTLFGVISGLTSPDTGTVRIADVDVTNFRPHQRTPLGLGRTFQRLELFGSLTVRDNIRVAGELARRWIPDLDPVRTADEILARLNLQDVARARAGALPTGLGRMVELARALAAKPRILLLDEPSSGLDHSESEQLGETMSGLAADGLCIVLVEHHVELVTSVCHWVYVLDFGELIAAGPPADIRADPRVQACYLGDTYGTTPPEPQHNGRRRARAASGAKSR